MLGVLALASGVVGFSSAPESGQPSETSHVSAGAEGQLRTLVASSHADVVAEAVAESVAESRGLRMSRSLARFELQTQALEGAVAIDRQMVDLAKEAAAEQVRAAAERAAKAQEEAERKAEAKREAEAAAKKKAAEEAAAEAARKKAARWVLPVVGGRLSASFGEGGGLWQNRHTGQDFAAPTGTPVRAAAAGVIVSAGYDGAYGRKIVIRHSDGTQTWYCHLSSFERTSGSVAAGTLIGRVGSTGNTTGPHLHFEVHPAGGDAVNPMSWLRARM